jgi:hypothetical protein
LHVWKMKVKSGRSSAKVDSQDEAAIAAESNIKKIKQLEEEIKASKQNLNNIPILIDMCETLLHEKDSRSATASMLALCRVFSRLMTDDASFLEPKKEAKPTESKKSEKSSKDIFIDWMSSNYKRFTRLLLQSLQKNDPTLQV